MECVAIGSVCSFLFGAVWRDVDDGDDDDVDGKRTGMKVLPSSKIPLARGLVLHDCHAEVEPKEKTSL